MADIDDKTQKLIDRAVKKQRSDDKKAILAAVKEATDTAKELEDKGQKKAVVDALKELKTSAGEVFAD